MQEPVRIICEVGSTHMGKLEYAFEAVERACEAGADAVKFQLFPNREPWVGTGNVHLSFEHYLRIAEKAEAFGIDCTASVFDDESFSNLLHTGPSFIKFAYSQRFQAGWIADTIEEGLEAIVSCDVMSDHYMHKKATKLYCIPEYPVRYLITFDQLFPRFQGFSDHTLGFDQTLEAVREGAKVIEKHVKLSKTDVNCPDSFFALSFPEFASMVACIRQLEKQGALP